MAAPAMSSAAAGERRVACPVCHGLIHPVAGRCKHCKADLTQAHALRTARAPAPPVAPLHALVAPVVVVPLVPLAPNPDFAPAPAVGMNYAPPGVGGVPADVTTSARGLAPFAEPTLPVYGPRGEIFSPDGSGTSAELPRPKWLWFVIGAAVIAVVVALVLLVWPADKPGDVKRIGAGGDSMNTNPMPFGGPKLPPGDPWSTPTPPSNPQVVPPDDPDTDPDVLPDDPDPNDLADQLNDLLGQLGGLGSGQGQALGGGTNTASGQFFDQVASAGCDRISACGLPEFICTQIKTVVTGAAGAMFSACTIDADKADVCVNRVRSLTCSDVSLQNFQDTAMSLAGPCGAAISCPAGSGIDFGSILGNGLKRSPTTPNDPFGP